MRVLGIRISDSDIRYYRPGDGYRIGIYQERNKPSPQNTGVVLVVYRVPLGTQAPVGRSTPEQLQALADEGLRQVEPEVIGRFPFWSYIEENGGPLEVPDDTECEPLVILPPSVRDGTGAYVLPPNGYEPLMKPPEKKAAKES